MKIILKVIDVKLQIVRVMPILLKMYDIRTLYRSNSLRQIGQVLKGSLYFYSAALAIYARINEVCLLFLLLRLLLHMVLSALMKLYAFVPAKKNNRSPIETITEIPMVSIKIPL